MKNEFTSIIERDGDWYIAYCPEVPGANGQGRTKDEARESLAAAITLILDDRREDVLRGLPKDASSFPLTFTPFYPILKIFTQPALINLI